MGDVLLGPGKLYRAPVATANPDESTVAFGAAWGGSWVDMGDFPEGSPITLTLAEEIYKVYSEQSTVAQAVSRTRREAMVKGGLLELSIANWAIALQGTAETTAAAGGGQKGYSEIPFGAQTDVTLYKWGIEALRIDSANANQPVRWFFHKGFFRMTGDVAYAKTKESMLPFEITVIGDDTQSAGEELGILQYVTAAATATA
jgi:hypothetical protein